MHNYFKLGAVRTNLAAVHTASQEEENSRILCMSEDVTENIIIG
jgi:hypothetical protein